MSHLKYMVGNIINDDIDQAITNFNHHLREKLATKIQEGHRGLDSKSVPHFVNSHMLENYVSNILHDVDNSLNSSDKYKSFKVYANTKTIEWVTQRGNKQDSLRVAKILAKSLTKSNFSGWTIKVVVRDDYYGDDSPWVSIKN